MYFFQLQKTLNQSLREYNGKDYIHDEIQEKEDTFGQEGAFEEMMAWSEDVFLDVAKDFDLEFEGA